jgi:hypothetical protein
VTRSEPERPDVITKYSNQSYQNLTARAAYYLAHSVNHDLGWGGGGGKQEEHNIHNAVCMGEGHRHSWGEKNA